MTATSLDMAYIDYGQLESSEVVYRWKGPEQSLAAAGHASQSLYLKWQITGEVPPIPSVGA